MVYTTYKLHLNSLWGNVGVINRCRDVLLVRVIAVVVVLEVVVKVVAVAEVGRGQRGQRGIDMVLWDRGSGISVV